MDGIERRYTRFGLRKVSGALRAEVTGVDLTQPFDDELKAQLRQAFLDNLVLVLRGQKMTERQQIDFTSIFGPVEPHPYYRSRMIEGYPEILVLQHEKGQWFNGKNDIWHTDLTFKPVPPMLGLLYCREATEGQGDTLFSNMYAAFDALSPGLKRFLDGMQAEHSAELLRARNNRASYNVPIGDVAAPVVHPVVRTHPETGRKALFVNSAFTLNFVGWTREESAPLLKQLFAAVNSHECIYRHRWRPDDVVLWDQRATQHYVVVDYGPEYRRCMHRTTATGDRPR